MGRIPNYVGLVAGIVAAFLGLFVLFGWITDSRALVQVLPDAVPMQYTTALSFAIAGLGLAWASKGRRRVQGATGALVLLLGATALLAYLTGLNVGLEGLFPRYITVGTSHPGRMAPNTSVAFTITGAALLVLGFVPARGRSPMLIAVLGSVVAALGGVALIGYLSGVETAYQWGSLTKMAVHTAAGFLFVGTGLLAHAWAEGTSSRVRFPGWLPIPVGLGGVVVTLALWQALLGASTERVRITTEAEAGRIAAELRQHLEPRFAELERMARRWDVRGGTPRAEWERDAALYVADSPAYRAVAWVDPSYRIAWIAPEERSAVIGLDVRADEQRRRALEEAEATGRSSVTRILEFFEGGRGFLVYVPLALEGDLGGFIGGALEVEPLLAEIGSNDGTRDYSIVLIDGDTRIPEPGAAAEPTRADQRAFTVSRDVGVRDLPWRIELWPSGPMLDGSFTALPLIVLALGLFAALLLSLTAFLAITTQREQLATELANRRLSREVAQRRRAEQLLKVKAAQLEASNRELEEFAYVASHDMKEPLRMVAGYTQLLADRYSGQLDDEADEFIAYAVDGAKRMQKLIADLLEYSRVGSGDVVRTAVEADRVVAQVLRDLSVAIEMSGGQVDVQDLPPVDADEAQLGRVFLNLIGNALKFRSPERPIRVTVTGERSDGQSVFRVSDNGIGMEPEHTSRIFQVFRRLHSRQAYDGTGIGLAICKKIVERHGGRIWCESVPDSGSTFGFTIPDAPDRQPS